MGTAGKKTRLCQQISLKAGARLVLGPSRMVALEGQRLGHAAPGLLPSPNPSFVKILASGSRTNPSPAPPHTPKLSAPYIRLRLRPRYRGGKLENRRRKVTGKAQPPQKCIFRLRVMAPFPRENAEAQGRILHRSAGLGGGVAVQGMGIFGVVGPQETTAEEGKAKP